MKIVKKEKEKRSEAIMYYKLANNTDFECFDRYFRNIKANEYDVMKPVTKLIRLGDFHELCIRIGKTIDISEDAVNEIIWENQKRVNEIAIEQDVIATTIISFMKYRSSYIDSMSNLLKLLKSEADCLAISQKLLPATPNHLSMRLKKVKSNLEEEYGIFFEVKNKGAYKEITIIKK